MSYSFTYSSTGANADGDSFIKQLTIVHNAKTARSQSVPAAKVGQLTTRGSTTAGTLTMAASHGFNTADKISLFWTNTDGTTGQRRNVVLGTVATNSCPFSGGSGDDLPANLTNITAMVPASAAFVVTGDNVIALGAACPTQGCVQFIDGSGTELAAYTFTDTVAGGGYPWASGNGVTNPLAGVTVATVKLSHADSAAARVLKAYAGY